jgi:hypothetical protein
MKMNEQDVTERLAASLLAPPPPAAESVARGRARLLAEATGQPGRHPRRRVTRRPVWVAMAAAGTAAAVTAAAVIAASPAAGHHPAAQTVVTPALRQAILTAFTSARGDILRAEYIVHVTPRSQSTATAWNWPAMPRQQQRARWRVRAGDAIDEEATGSFAGLAGQRVCYPLSRRLPANAAPSSVTFVWPHLRAWGHQLVRQPITTPPMESPACLLSEIAEGIWHVSHVKWHGQAALELTPAAHGTFLAALWLDARTYLPLAEHLGRPGSPELNFQLLPPTPANLAQLRVTVPGGFRRLPPNPHMTFIEPYLWSALG